MMSSLVVVVVGITLGHQLFDAVWNFGILRFLRDKEPP